jgi:hypothetical protein
MSKAVKKSKKKGPHASLRIIIRKKAGKPVKTFNVVFMENSSKVLSVCEPQKSLKAAHAKIGAHVKLAAGTSMLVVETNGSVEKQYFINGECIVMGDTADNNGTFEPTLTVETDEPYTRDDSDDEGGRNSDDEDQD